VTEPQFSRCISLSNIVISIVIIGEEEVLNVIKIKRLAVAGSIVIAVIHSHSVLSITIFTLRYGM